MAAFFEFIPEKGQCMISSFLQLILVLLLLPLRPLFRLLYVVSFLSFFFRFVDSDWLRLLIGSHVTIFFFLLPSFYVLFRFVDDEASVG